MIPLHLFYLLLRPLIALYYRKHLKLALFAGCFCFVPLAPAQSVTNEGYQVSQVEPELFMQTIQRTGKVDFARVVNLSFKTAGFLAQLTVDEGDVFKNKQLLAALDISELEAEKNGSYSRLLQAKRNIVRVKALMKKNLSSQRELDDAMTAVETTRANYRVANYNLDKAQITAPFEGVVIQRNTDLGELQAPGASVLQVASLVNNLIVSVALTGEEIALVRLNQKVKVDLAYSGAVDGVISKMPAIADSRNHLFNIEVSLDEEQIIKPLVVGQLARILIKAQTEHFVYRLPIEALNAINETGQALVTIEINNKPVQQAFTIYKLDNNFIYLTSEENAKVLAAVTQGWNKHSLTSTKQ